MDSATYRHVFEIYDGFKELNGDEQNPDGEDEFCKQFILNKPFDYAVNGSSMLYFGCGIFDTAEDLVQRKLSWTKQLQFVKPHQAAKSAIKDLRAFQRNQTGNLSIKLRQCLQHFEDDPEPGFHGDYNWLYTGGNLSTCSLDDSLFLFSSDLSANRTVLNVMKLNENCNRYQEISSFQLRKNIPILQIECKRKEENTLVCSRQRNDFMLFTVNEWMHFKKVWKKKVNKKKFLTSCDIKSDCEAVLIADNAFNINIYSTEKGRKLYGCKIKKSGARDSWNQVAFGEQGVYCADRNSFYIIDHRDKTCKISLRHKPTSIIEKCEVINSMTTSNCNPHFVYLAMSHSLVLVDIRNATNNQKWTHMMKGAPQHCQTIQHENNELIVLQSKYPEEMIGITNEYSPENESHHFFSRSIPRALDGINETLRLAQYNGLCLGPEFRKRLNSVTTGAQLAKGKHGSIHLFVGSGVGDISSVKLEKRSGAQSQQDSADMKIALESMEEYETHLNNLDRNPTLYATNLIDMKHVLKRFEDKNLRLKKYKLPDVNWRYGEMFSPDSLLLYKDLLARNILDVWGIEKEDFEEEKTEHHFDDRKVHEWLDKLND